MLSNADAQHTEMANEVVAKLQADRDLFLGTLGSEGWLESLRMEAITHFMSLGIAGSEAEDAVADYMARSSNPTETLETLVAEQRLADKLALSGDVAAEFVRADSAAEENSPGTR